MWERQTYHQITMGCAKGCDIGYAGPLGYTGGGPALEDMGTWELLH